MASESSRAHLCRELEPQISAFHDGELSPEEGQELRNEIDACDRCSAYHRELTALSKALGCETEPDLFFVSRFRARRDELSVAPWWTWRELALRLLPLALAAVLAAAATVVMTVEPAADRQSLQSLETQALGDPDDFQADELPAMDSVLRITLEPFPAEEP